MTDNAYDALRRLTNTIEATGGLTLAGAPVGDPAWMDLGDAYRAAKIALEEPAHPTHTVYDSETGAAVGALFANDPEQFDREYAETCDDPEGHVRAGSIIPFDDLENLSLSADSTIYITRI